MGNYGNTVVEYVNAYGRCRLIAGFELGWLKKNAFKKAMYMIAYANAYGRCRLKAGFELG